MYMKKNNKYFAHKVSFRGMVFDSRYELNRYLYLQFQCKMNEIQDLRRQVSFLIIPKTVRLVPKRLKTKVKMEERVVEQESVYTCDFLYREGDKYVIEEFKSEYTAKLQDYILRRKLMIRKIYEHNAKKRSQWIFRSCVYSERGQLTITDK